MATEDDQEFRQVGHTWLHTRHTEPEHGVVVSIANEHTMHTESAVLTTAMARQLRDWLLGHYPVELLTASPERPYQKCGE